MAYSVLQLKGHTLHTALHGRHRLFLYSISILFEAFAVAFVWLWGLRATRTRLRDLIGGRWSRVSDVFRDICVAVVFWINVWFCLMILGIAFGPDKSASNSLKAMAPQSFAEFIGWVALSFTAGFCEELVFRGYLQRQLFAITGRSWIAVALQAFVFGSIHLYQGWRGAIGITVYGVLFGLLVIVRKSLRPGMIQHAGQDILAGILLSVLGKHKYI